MFDGTIRRVADRRPFISLVTPSLNQGRFIRRTIDSVLSQQYPRLEYTVQDGGSTDETAAVLASFGRSLSFWSEPDLGQADAINRGLQRASGEVFGFLNSDDVLLPGCLEAVGRAFAEHPEALCVFGAAQFIDADDALIGPCPVWPDAFRQLDHCCALTQPAMFFRRRVWDEVGPFDVRLHHALDYDYWFRIRARFGDSCAVFLDRPLAAARVHADAKTVAAWGRALSEIYSVVERHTGHLSVWWCLARWDHLLDGRSQTTAPHRYRVRVVLAALAEFIVRNRITYWWPALRQAGGRRLKKAMAQP